MKTLTMMLALLMCSSLQAQGEKPTDPPPAPEPAPTSLGISADLNTFIKQVYPELDPAGEHDLFKLKNYSDAAKRHEYTGAMARLVALYVTRLDLGSTVAKVFDQYARGKEGAQVTFKVLHAVQMLQYPPGSSNWPEAEKILREAGAMAPDYAYPWYFLGEVEIAKLRSGLVSNPKGAMEAVDAALKIKPDFFAAVLLKADLLMGHRPPKEAEAAKLLEPLLAKIAPSPADLENLLSSYGRVTTQAKMLAYIDELLKRPGMTPNLKASACTIAASAHKHVMALDDAITWMERSRKEVDIKVDPEAVIRSYRFTAECWGMKAVQLREKDPALTGENRTRFNQFVEAARKDFLTGSDLDAKYLPIELRGMEAQRYVTFLYSIGELESALTWLEEYLESTALPVHTRNVLERMLLQIRAKVDPNEEILVEQFRDLVSRDETEGLVIALDTARVSAETGGVHFKTLPALKFFIDQLKHRDRRVVELSARLAADTAVTMRKSDKDEAAGKARVAETGQAIAARLEDEIECKSEDQSMLQTALVRTLIELEHWPSLARAGRHVRKLLDGMELADRPVPRQLERVINVLVRKEFQDKITDKPEVPGALQRRKAGVVSEWLQKLAEAMDKMHQA
ncbi:MAG: hypothetical protein KF754_02660 [Planctomycetes bacterium]|nr:hypothetical protein [Planctomycetota bacterium]